MQGEKSEETDTGPRDQSAKSRKVGYKLTNLILESCFYLFFGGGLS